MTTFVILISGGGICCIVKVPEATIKTLSKLTNKDLYSSTTESSANTKKIQEKIKETKDKTEATIKEIKVLNDNKFKKEENIACTEEEIKIYFQKVTKNLTTINKKEEQLSNLNIELTNAANKKTEHEAELKKINEYIATQEKTVDKNFLSELEEIKNEKKTTLEKLEQVKQKEELQNEKTGKIYTEDELKEKQTEIKTKKTELHEQISIVEKQKEAIAKAQKRFDSSAYIYIHQVNLYNKPWQIEQNLIKAKEERDKSPITEEIHAQNVKNFKKYEKTEWVFEEYIETKTYFDSLIEEQKDKQIEIDRLENFKKDLTDKEKLAKEQDDKIAVLIQTTTDTITEKQQLQKQLNSDKSKIKNDQDKLKQTKEEKAKILIDLQLKNSEKQNITQTIIELEEYLD